MLKHITSLCVFTVLILLSLATIGSTLKCYQCNSYYNESCTTLDLTSKEYIQPCKKGETICRIMWIDTRGSKRVVRSCGTEKYKNPCYVATTTDVKTHTCECEQDGCNTALQLRSDVFKLVCIVLISLFLIR